MSYSKFYFYNICNTKVISRLFVLFSCSDFDGLDDYVSLSNNIYTYHKRILFENEFDIGSLKNK